MKATEETTIRPLALTDHAEWLRMRRALWPECSDDVHAYAMRIYSEEPERAQVFVHSRKDGSLGGFLEVCIRDRVEGSFCRRVGYIQSWYVDPDIRRKRIGRRLFDAAETWARDQGVAEIGSDCGVGNDDSLAMHAAMGFEETSRLAHFLKKIRTQDLDQASDRAVSRRSPRRPFRTSTKNRVVVSLL